VAPAAATAPLELAEIPKPAALVRLALDELPTIIVNLDRRPDRLEGCSERLQAHCSGLSWSRFSATDGKNTSIPENEVVLSWNTARNCVFQRMRSVRKGWDDLESYKELQLGLSPGERGCASSHIRAWRRCLELAESCGSERPLLVLEDDAAPTEDFEAVLKKAMAALPEDAHVLYLGYSQAADWRREVIPELVEAEYVWTTVAYIIWPAGARKLLSRLPVDQPVDNWMGGLNAAGDLKAYCARPKIVRQAEPWNVNSDVAHSDEHYWGVDSDIRHSDSFYWGPATQQQQQQQQQQQPDENGGGRGEEASVELDGSIAGGSLWEDGGSDDDDEDADETADGAVGGAASGLQD